MDDVEVLLATYNGERFLREQVDSILGQSYADVRVTARDDGSADGTVAILEEYERRFPGRFRVVRDAVERAWRGEVELHPAARAFDGTLRVPGGPRRCLEA